MTALQVNAYASSFFFVCYRCYVIIREATKLHSLFFLYRHCIIIFGKQKRREKKRYAGQISKPIRNKFQFHELHNIYMRSPVRIITGYRWLAGSAVDLDELHTHTIFSASCFRGALVSESK